MNSIGLLGGTFDPLHHGHLNLALELQERCNLSEIWFIPAFLSPFRNSNHVASHHRLKMLELALAPFKNFKIVDLELSRPAPSYTIDTLNQLFALHPEARFSLLLGEDSALQLGRWKSAEEIVKKIPLLVGKRLGGALKESILQQKLPSSIEDSILKSFIDIPQMDISSTMIRSRLKQSLYCYHLLPAILLDYIYENQLYFND